MGISAHFTPGSERCSHPGLNPLDTRMAATLSPYKYKKSIAYKQCFSIVYFIFSYYIIHIKRSKNRAFRQIKK